MTGLLAELKWRGFVHDATPGLDAHLAQGPLTVYCGFDPTAPSLQLGNLIPLMLLKHLQLAGHRPIVLMGGGTGLIGDPSGKKTERPLLSKQQLRSNLGQQENQVRRFLELDDRRGFLMDNAEWLASEGRPLSLVDFLRDVGKHFTISVMLQKESVRARLKEGLSFTEFSYMLLQAYDYLQLHERKQCTLQVGGSDQWGNITAGIELVRRATGAEVHGLVAPLITTASGAKFGKSESGAIYLDPQLTSPYKFYQFWVNADDRDVERYLKVFTLKTRHEITSLLKEHATELGSRLAQKVLAEDATRIAHGSETTANVVAAASILFGDLDLCNTTRFHFDILATELPTVTLRASATNEPTDQLKRSTSIPLLETLVELRLVKSKGEARRTVQQGGVEINRTRVTNVDRVLGSGDWLCDQNILVCKGKKHFGLVRLWP